MRNNEPSTSSSVGSKSKQWSWLHQAKASETVPSTNRLTAWNRWASSESEAEVDDELGTAQVGVNGQAFQFDGLNRLTSPKGETEVGDGLGPAEAGSNMAWEQKPTATEQRVNRSASPQGEAEVGDELGKAKVGTNLYTADDERIWQYQVPAPNTNFWAVRDLGGNRWTSSKSETEVDDELGTAQVGVKVLREFKQAGAVWTVERDYIYRGGTLLASETPAGRRYFTTDHLGTPRHITDAVGATVSTHTYFPYGEEASAFNADDEQMKFTGHERDLGSTTSAADDLDYMHARHYGPLVGRFLSVDAGLPRRATARLAAWNGYRYGSSNPATRIDRDGNKDWYFSFAKDSGVLLDVQKQVMLRIQQKLMSYGAKRVTTRLGTRSVFAVLLRSTVQVNVSQRPFRDSSGDGRQESSADKIDVRTANVLKLQPSAVALQNFLVNTILHERAHTATPDPYFLDGAGGRRGKTGTITDKYDAAASSAAEREFSDVDAARVVADENVDGFLYNLLYDSQSPAGGLGLLFGDFDGTVYLDGVEIVVLGR